MGKVRSAGAWLGLVAPDEDDWYDDELAVDQEIAEMSSEHNRQIATLYPVTFQDARTVGRYFRDDVPVIMNLSGLNDGEAKRFVDFASGLILGRRGTLERISHRVFLLLPPGIAILSAQDAAEDHDGFFNQG